MDLNKIKAKLEALKNGSNGSLYSKNIWKPNKTGAESQIRLFSNPRGDADDPFIEVFSHYALGVPGIICLKNTFGKTCPLCEFGKSLYQDGSEKDKELAKKFFPRERYYAAMIDRSEEEPTAKYWGFGKLIYQQLLEALFDDDYSNYLDPMNGLDMVVKQTREKGKTYPDTNFTFRRKESKLAGTQAQIDSIQNSVMDIFEIMKPPTKEEVSVRLKKWLEEQSGETPEEASTEIEKGSTKSTDNVDELFDEVLG